MSRRQLGRGGAATGAGCDVEAAQRPRVFPREARKTEFLGLFFDAQEAALVASRFIEGHHVCFSQWGR